MMRGVDNARRIGVAGVELEASPQLMIDCPAFKKTNPAQSRHQIRGQQETRNLCAIRHGYSASRPARDICPESSGPPGPTPLTLGEIRPKRKFYSPDNGLWIETANFR